MALDRRSDFIVSRSTGVRTATTVGRTRRSSWYVRLGLVVWLLIAVILVGVFVYTIATPNPAHLYRIGSVPLLFITLLLMALTLRLRQDLPPIIILIAAAFIPFSLATGTVSRVVDSLILSLWFVAAWVARSIVVERRFNLRKFSINTPILGFMAVVVISLIWSVVFRDPLVMVWNSFPRVQLASAAVMVGLPATFLLVANQVNRLKILKAMVGLMLVAGVLGLVKQYLSIEIPINTGGLFAMWVVALSAGLAIFHRKLRMIWRLLLLLLVGAWIFWGFGLNINWLAGWLPGMIALGVLSAMRSKRHLLVFILVLGLIVLSNPSYYLGTVLQTEADRSLNTRFAAWKANWRVTSQHLLFGTGPAGYAAYYMSYFPDEAMATHSNYIDILAQTGVVGFALMIWFLVALTRIGFRLYRRLHGMGDFKEALGNAAVAGFLGCIVIMGFGDWIFPFPYTQGISGYDHAIYSWLFMGSILVLDRLTAGRPQEGVDGIRFSTA